MTETGQALVQDINASIEVMKEVSSWMSENQKKVSKWWQLDNLNKKFLLQHAKENEFYIFLENSEPAASLVIQDIQDNPEWSGLDRESPQRATYLHWICIKPKFMGKGLLQKIMVLVYDITKSKGIGLIRVDTNAAEPKLRKTYEDLGFKLVDEVDEGYRVTAFYEKEVSQSHID